MRDIYYINMFRDEHGALTASEVGEHYSIDLAVDEATLYTQKYNWQYVATLSNDEKDHTGYVKSQLRHFDKLWSELPDEVVVEEYTIDELEGIISEDRYGGEYEQHNTHWGL